MGGGVEEVRQELLHVGAQLDDAVSKHLQGALSQSTRVGSSARELEPPRLLPVTVEHPGPITKWLNVLDQSQSSSTSWTKILNVRVCMRVRACVRVYLIRLGTCVPYGTGPLVGRTKRPLEFWTLSLRKMDT